MKRINPKKLYWSSWNHFEFRMSGEEVLACSHQGDCEADCRHHAPAILKRMKRDNFTNRPTPDKIRKELDEYGCWDEEELKDDEMNFIRLIWRAAGSIKEDDERDCSPPVKNKTKPDQPTKVIFRKWEGDHSVIAYFPEEPGTNDPSTCASYMHVGQHGAAGCDIYTTVPAAPEEYASLKKELESAPYHYFLKVVKKFTRKHFETRRDQINQQGK